jgi:hypothetical protein
MKVTINHYHAVATWKWNLKPSTAAAALDQQQSHDDDVGEQEEEEDDDDDDDVCGICRVAFDGCCPDCKIPGDGCPPGSVSPLFPLSRSLHSLTRTNKQSGENAPTCFTCIA